MDNRLHMPILDQANAVATAWQPALAAAAAELARVARHVQTRLDAGACIYPARPFRALDEVAPADVRVVILGQDPYHGPGQATGLAFAVPSDCKRPPSLRNIQAELVREFPEAAMAACGNDLTHWAKQGVLLLNTVLTVEDGQPASHAKQGWEAVTDALITLVARDPNPKVFMLWGAHAQAKRALLPAASRHLVLTANHPSPLSARRPPAPFLGCGHFAAANRWLVEQGRLPVDWL